MRSFVCFLGLVALAVALPRLNDDLCDLDTIYDAIKTGTVREQTLTVENAQVGELMDGVGFADLITINGGSPGPEIHVVLGDTVKITVQNNMRNDFILHFHGQTFFRDPWMDGDQNIANCPTEPTRNFTYEWIAHPAGTSFYHAHIGSQRTRGAWGAFIVHEKEEVFDETRDFVVGVTDWYHQTFPGNTADDWYVTLNNSCVTMATRHYGWWNLPSALPFPLNAFGSLAANSITFQSVTVNGKGHYDYPGTRLALFPPGVEVTNCYGQYQLLPDPFVPQCARCTSSTDVRTSVPCAASAADSWCGSFTFFDATAGVENRFRFFNTGMQFALQVCVDGHMSTIVAVDGMPVTPFEVPCFIIAPAERFDVMINANQPAGVYTIRFTTLEYQTPGDVVMGSNDYGLNLPNYGYAFLRYGDVPVAPVALPDPPACTADSVNCGPQYWINQTTLGCSMNNVAADPDRCLSIHELTGAPSSDSRICEENNKKMAHQVDATEKMSLKMSFYPFEAGPPMSPYDGVTRNANFGRMEIFPESEYAFPYNESPNPAEWNPRNPVSFKLPPVPVLDLSIADRESIYSRRTTWSDNPLPAVPEGFAKVVSGTNGIFLQYGSVVQIVMNCTEPFGLGCGRSHPFHLHGHKFAVLYIGQYNEPYNASNFNTQNPVYRDTFVLYTDGWYAIQFVVNNPGGWRLHCHINTHVFIGMSVLFDVTGDDSVEQARRAPREENNCFVPSDVDGSSAAAQTVPLTTFTILILSFWRLFLN